MVTASKHNKHTHIHTHRQPNFVVFSRINTRRNFEFVDALYSTRKIYNQFLKIT